MFMRLGFDFEWVELGERSGAVNVRFDRGV